MDNTIFSDPEIIPFGNCEIRIGETMFLFLRNHAVYFLSDAVRRLDEMVQKSEIDSALLLCTASEFINLHPFFKQYDPTESLGMEILLGASVYVQQLAPLDYQQRLQYYWIGDMPDRHEGIIKLLTGSEYEQYYDTVEKNWFDSAFGKYFTAYLFADTVMKLVSKPEINHIPHYRPRMRSAIFTLLNQYQSSGESLCVFLLSGLEDIEEAYQRYVMGAPAVRKYGNSILDAILFELKIIGEENIPIKRCRQCGTYFYRPYQELLRLAPLASPTSRM